MIVTICYHISDSVLHMKIYNTTSSQPISGDRKSDKDYDAQKDTGVLTKIKPKTKRPSMYKVLLLNDDYTPMEFVVMILKRFFFKNETESIDITMTIHRKGVGLCGVYTYEIAETKVAQVMACATENEHPLQCTMEKE